MDGGAIASGVLLYLLLCLTAVMVGEGLHRILGFRLGPWESGLTAPVSALAFWSLSLAISTRFRVPTSRVTPWLWLATWVLALLGARRCWANIRVAAPALLLCCCLPLVVLVDHVVLGLNNHPGSIAPDGWSYIAVGRYLWEHPRGAAGGLAPLHEWASHLSEGRWVSFSLLGFLSPLVRTGDTQSVSGLFKAFALFTMTSSVALYWKTQAASIGARVAGVVLATAAGWTANIVSANNYDNLLALTYMPALAGAARCFAPRDMRGWVFQGVLLAAAVYTYPEMGVLIGGAAALINLPLLCQGRKEWTAWARGIGVALVVAGALIALDASHLRGYFLEQFQASRSSAHRPGEGVFAGLLDHRYQLAAVWGLGGEHRLVRFNLLRCIAGGVLSVLAFVGLLTMLRRGQWGIVAATILLAVGAGNFIVREQYSYGAYKFIVLNWWCLAAAVVAGAERFYVGVGRPWPRRITGAALGVLGIFFLTQSNHARDSITVRTKRPMSEFRRLIEIREITGDSPILAVFDDWYAYEWALYYLVDAPVCYASHHMYPGMPHVLHLQDRARVPSPETAGWLLTDSGFDERFDKGPAWNLVWSVGPYRLWRHEGPWWAILSRIKNPNGVETRDGKVFFPLGQDGARAEIITNKAGTLWAAATFLLGPGAPDAPGGNLLVGARGVPPAHWAVKGGRPETFPITVKAGKTSVLLKPVGRLTTASLRGGGPRPPVLGMLDVKLSPTRPANAVPARISPPSAAPRVQLLLKDRAAGQKE